jgi:UDP-hydrolysing UDP-N-acetyl-D-glucosamine 2-epimerase
MPKRKICVVVNSRANYGRIKSVMREVQNHPTLELQLIVGASALLHRFGKVLDVIKDDGFTPSAVVYSVVEGENPTTMAKSTGMGILELATQFENLRPDIVLTVADRYETMATAIAASYMNIPLAHTQGGEVTGNIDESVRHAITKLAHIHFPATEKSAQNIVRMGEDPATVFMTGCPAIDLVAEIDTTMPDDFFRRHGGVGSPATPNTPYLVVLQHPVTTEFGSGSLQVRETLQAVKNMHMPTIWLWPNIDAGSDDVSKELRVFREKERPDYIQFVRNFPPEEYVRLIANCACQIGNSSSAIREGSYLGVPAVNIGTRQSGREKASNILCVDYQANEIETAIRKQLRHGRYSPSHLYGDGNAGKRITECLAECNPSIVKKLHYS